jgi:CO/xanthine dehydrogenase FAD-binding subunit
VLAGGLDVLQKMSRWDLDPECLVSLRRIPELAYVRIERVEGQAVQSLVLGPMATLRDLERSEAVRSTLPMLFEVAHQIASVQVKTMGTVIGNLCVATPASDIAPALYALGAHLEITNEDSARWVPIEQFFIPVCQSILTPAEIVTKVAVPLPVPGSAASFRKLAHTKACIAKVNAAVSITLSDGACTNARIALGAVGPTVLRATRGEEVLRGAQLSRKVIAEAAERAAMHATPIDDLRSTAEYRQEMCKVLVRRALAEAAARASTSVGGGAKPAPEGEGARS